MGGERVLMFDSSERAAVDARQRELSVGAVRFQAKKRVMDVLQQEICATWGRARIAMLASAELRPPPPPRHRPLIRVRDPQERDLVEVPRRELESER